MKPLAHYSRWIALIAVGIVAVIFQTQACAAEDTGLTRIAGIVWADSNNNGILEPDEATLPGYPVYLQRVDMEAVGAMVALVHTDEDGTFVFDRLEQGTYQVYTDAGFSTQIEVLDVSIATVIEVPVQQLHRAQQMHSIFLPLTVR